MSRSRIRHQRNHAAWANNGLFSFFLYSFFTISIRKKWQILLFIDLGSYSHASFTTLHFGKDFAAFVHSLWTENILINWVHINLIILEKVKSIEGPSGFWEWLHKLSVKGKHPWVRNYYVWESKNMNSSCTCPSCTDHCKTTLMQTCYLGAGQVSRTLPFNMADGERMDRRVV